jgi:hypothetical protein
MRASTVPNLCELTQRMDNPEILPAVDIDYDSRFQCRWFRIIPEKEFFSIASEGDFYEMSHFNWIA